jgi:glutamyl-Q tRNA(Asp) synthetase
MSDASARPVFRFAPSPNGFLHLGHAYSALLNDAMAKAADGRFLLRIEDIDLARCKPQYERAILDDLAWLGLVFGEPPRRQSDHGADYASALDLLAARALVYPCFCTRAEVARASGGARDPDGAPRYPGTCRLMSAGARAARLARGESPAMRLDMARALAAAPVDLDWREYGEGTLATRMSAEPSAWGDFVLKRKGMPASYHLAVVVDDGLQGITDVVRGADLQPSTSAHRLLQELLGIAAPRYRHHRLVRDSAGGKMSKSALSTPLRHLRRDGLAAADIRAALGFGDARTTPLKAMIS